MRPILYHLAGLGLTWVAGCSDHAMPSSFTADANDVQVGCKNDPRVDPTYIGTRKLGAQGLMRFTLQAADPALVVRGANAWTMALSDPNGTPLSAASWTVIPTMPDHGHGTAAVPQAQAQGDATVLSPLYFFMAGVWQTKVTASVGGQTDSALFWTCVE